MSTFTLTPHPTTPSEFIRAVNVQTQSLPGARMRLRYGVTGELDHLLVPDARRAARVDGLWRTTCFEAFLRSARDLAYQEFNFSPAGEWAAYAFSSQRQGMKPLDQPEPPRIACRRTAQRLEVEVQLQSPLLSRPDVRAALTAVLQLKDGTVSYWALAHAAGKPDFHAPAGFTATGLVRDFQET